MRKAEIYAIIATLVVLMMMFIITLDSDINPYPLISAYYAGSLARRNRQRRHALLRAVTLITFLPWLYS